MATETPRPTTLAQYKAALERTEAARLGLVQDLDSCRKAQAQLRKDLEAAQGMARIQQEQLRELQASTQSTQARLQQENATLAAQLLAAQAAAEQAKTEQARVETQAGQQLLQAQEMLTRLKLEATACADREIKREKVIAALEAQRQAATAPQEAAPDTAAELKRLQLQIDGLVAENRLMAQTRDQMAQDQQALLTKVEGQGEALSKAVAQAQDETRQQAAQEIGQLQVAAKLNQERLAALSAQLQSSGKLEVLAPEQVGALMGRFLQQVEGGLPRLKLAEGELKLKLGLAQSGQTQGFVILQPGAQVSNEATVHEVALKFDRAGMLPLQLSKP
jgi:chromosome segregation ATPase